MKTKLLLSLTPLLAVLPSAVAAPYVVLTAPAGYSAPIIK